MSRLSSGENPPPKTKAEQEAAKEMSTLLVGIISHRKTKVARLKKLAKIVRDQNLSKNMLGGIVGNVLEWYDFAVFGFFAPVIGSLFFPSDDPLTSLLGAFGAFAAAFLARPLGGIFFGYIGDQFGRKSALQLSVMLMAVPTFLIGLLPTYDQIGTLAPVLLILLRVVQGLSVGGELVGSIAFVAETAPANQRGYFGSWTFASCYGGMTLGALSAVALNSIIGAEAVADWGWRLPFLAGILIGIAGLWMRKELTETPVFEQMQAEGKLDENPVRDALQLVSGTIFHASTLVVLVGGGFYLIFVWWPTFLSRYIHPHMDHIMVINTLSMILLIGLIPIMGRLSDEWGRKSLLVTSAAGMALLSWPLLTMVAADGSLFSVIFAQLCFTVLMSAFLGPIPATLVEMFPPRLLYSSIGISYNVSLSIFGGLSPFIATWLFKNYQTVSAPGLYLTGLSILSLLAALGLSENSPGNKN